jgi:hypothetical protein
LTDRKRVWKYESPAFFVIIYSALQKNLAFSQYM